ncbi:hypothetical protein F3087_33995 [Nocardia colli]|uniref:Uncharacterized protein n=1 Tax=Nocardia colli TaxID=2545717 RepID=A0A5N0E479_9NOCA|nr:hypothetical protein F3087_33995 [Nocardia colli]
MPHAACRMPHAACRMPHAACRMPHSKQRPVPGQFGNGPLCMSLRGSPTGDQCPHGCVTLA